MPQSTAIVIDRDPQWLEAVARALVKSSVDVLATTVSLADAFRLVDQLRPGLIVLEITIEEGELTGLTWLTEIASRLPAPKIIALSNSNEPDDIEAAFAGGASAYVVKRANPSDVAAAVRQLADRSLYLAGQPQSEEAVSSDGREFGLTKREVEILRLAAEGLTNSQIASHLWVSVQTVKFHLANTYRKLGVSNRTEASRHAQHHGLLGATQTDGQTQRSLMSADRSSKLPD